MHTHVFVPQLGEYRSCLHPAINSTAQRYSDGVN